MNTIALFVALPLGAAFLTALSWKIPVRAKDALAVAVTLVLLVFSVSVLGRNMPPLYVGGWAPVDGVAIGIQMTLDGLSALLLVVVNLIAFLTALYSVRYMERYTEKAKYWILFLLMLTGMNGVVLSGDMFNLFVFLEISAISSYALVAFGTGAEELEASFKYQVMGAVGSSLILLGIAVLYGLTGTLNMADMGSLLAARESGNTVLFVEVLFLVGFGLKAAQVPFHAWLPDAHPAAPAPISALLSGVLIKSLGVYAMMRVFFCVLGMTSAIAVVFMTLGTLSMVVGVLLALPQNDLKRLLAYSSISQVGYVFLGLGVGAAALHRAPAAAGLAFLAALFHLANHATFKSLLFLNSGAIEQGTGTRNLDEMGGLKTPMPVTSATGVVGSLAIAGVPPFNGFWSKLLLIVAVAQAGYYALAAVAAIVAILTLATFLKVQGAVWLGTLPERLRHVREVPALMCGPMVVLAVLCVVLGVLLLDPLRPLVLEPAVEVLKGGVAAYGRTGWGG